MRIEYHRTLLADAPRNAAFKAALAALIKPGISTVADIGAGTGVLGFMAARLGAKRVYLYESAAVLEVAERIRRLNRIDNVELVPIHSTDVIDPPKVDIVVSETLGNYPYEENIIQTMKDARRRFLKRDGVILPSRITQFVCPVLSPRYYRELTVWDQLGLELDFAPARMMSLNNAYVRRFLPADLLGEGRLAEAWDELDFARAPATTRKGRAQWRITERARIHGFALWWQAELAASISLSTSPLAAPTHWEQLYLPVLQPLELGPGDVLGAELSSRSTIDNGTTIAWCALRSDRNGRTLNREDMDLEKGYLP